MTTSDWTAGLPGRLDVVDAGDSGQRGDSGLIVLNLTPHPVRVQATPDGPAVVFDPAGPVARVREVSGAAKQVDTVGGQVPIQYIRYAATIDELPEPQPGVLYLVSRVTAAAVQRDDLVFPLGELRNEYGTITGCRALGTFHPSNQAGCDA